MTSVGAARDALVGLHWRLIDRLAPWGTATGNEFERQRVSLLVTCVYQELFWAPVFAALYWVLGPYWILQAGLMANAAIALGTLYFIRRGSLRAAETTLTLNLFGALTFLSWFTGGLSAPALIWMVAVPLISSAFTYGKSSTTWPLITVSVIVLMFALEHFGLYIFPNVLSAEHHSLMTTAALVGLSLLLLQIHAQHQHLRAFLNEQIRNEQRDLAAVLDAAPHAVFALDRDGRVQRCSEVAADTLGCGREEVIGKLLADFVPALDPVAFFDGSSKVSSHVGKRAGGEEFPLSLSMESYGTPDSPRYVAIARDVTEEQKREAELRHAHKMEAVGRLAGGIAHDFNNLLSIITGHTQFLLPAVAHDPQAQEDLLAVEGAAARATFLVHEMLTFSRGVEHCPDRPAHIDISSAVRRAAGMLRRVLPERIAVEVSATEDHCASMIHDTRLEQVILNIALNARDAMPDGGTLSLKTYTRSGGATAPAGIWSVIEIADTGIGMEKHVVDRVFEPFFTTKPVGQGSGFGLATAHGIILGAHGFIDVQSTPKRGTVFTVWLPQSIEGPEGSEANDVAAEAVSRLVLVIEDEPALRKIARRLFESREFTVIEAADGEEAVAVARACQRPIDLIFSDVVMPRMGGIEAVGHIRKSQPHARTIFVSGFPRDAEDLPSELSGDRFLRKPYTSQQLFEAVESLLDAAAPSPMKPSPMKAAS